jgi:hypothetical protein
MIAARIDFERQLKLRLVVGRIGEMDLAKWWNTRGQLSQLGSAAVRRGFPRTHYFAQARAVFAVAGFRCREVFDPPAIFGISSGLSVACSMSSVLTDIPVPTRPAYRSRPSGS